MIITKQEKCYINKSSSRPNFPPGRRKETGARRKPPVTFYDLNYPCVLPDQIFAFVEFRNKRREQTFEIFC